MLASSRNIVFRKSLNSLRHLLIGIRVSREPSLQLIQVLPDDRTLPSSDYHVDELISFCLASINDLVYWEMWTESKIVNALFYAATFDIVGNVLRVSDLQRHIMLSFKLMPLRLALQCYTLILSIY